MWGGRSGTSVSRAHSCKRRHIRLQPLPPTVAAYATYGCSPHYIRLQAVPKIAWAEHRLEVGGMVGAPKTFTMDDLLAMPSRELPVTPCSCRCYRLQPYVAGAATVRTPRMMCCSPLTAHSEQLTASG